MARTKGALDIKGWREHGLIRDLALGAESVEDLAERYGISPATVYGFKDRKKAQIAAVLADWSNEFSDLWAVKKHARVADLVALANTLQQRMDELEEDAARATETMRRIEPDAAPVRVSLRDWRGLVRDKARLEQQICDELGQNAAYIDGMAHDQGALFRMRQLGLIPTEQVRKQHRELNSIPEPESRRREESANARAIRELLEDVRNRFAVPEVPPAQAIVEPDAEDNVVDTSSGVQDAPPVPEKEDDVDLFRVMPSKPVQAQEPAGGHPFPVNTSTAAGPVEASQGQTQVPVPTPQSRALSKRL